VKLTPDDFEVWKAMPQTQAFMALVDEEIKEITEEIIDGRTIDLDSANLTAMKTAGMIGRIRGLMKLRDLEVEED